MLPALGDTQVRVTRHRILLLHIQKVCHYSERSSADYATCVLADVSIFIVIFTFVLVLWHGAPTPEHTTLYA